MNAVPKPLPTLDEPLETLATCHQKIEEQLCALERLVPHVASHGADADARAAALGVMRYFDTAGEAHHRDEDEVLFPMIRSAAARDRRNVIGATLYELEREHANMDRLYSDVRERLQNIVKGDAEVQCLDAELVSRFAWIYRRHMRLEADLILPYAREALDAGQRAMLGERMAARRRHVN